MRRQNAARIPALLYHGDALILIRCFLSLFLLLSRDFPSIVCVWYDYPTLHNTVAKTALQDNMGKSCMVVCS